MGERARKADQLFLARRQRRSPLQHGFVKTVWQRANEVGDVHFLGRIGDLIRCNPVRPKPDILGDRPGEEERILQHHPKAPPQLVQVLLANIDAIDQHSSALHIVKAHHQRRDRCLARTRVPNDSGSCVGLDRETYAAQNPFNIAASTELIARQRAHTLLLFIREPLIREPDTTKFNPAAAIAGRGVSASLNLGRCVEQLEDAFCRGHRSLQDVVFVAEVLDRPEEPLRILDERDENAERNHRVQKACMRLQCRRRMQHCHPPAPDHQRDRNRAEKLHYRIVQSVGEDSIGPRLLVLVVDCREVVERPLLAIEQLHDTHARDILLREGVDLRGRNPLPPVTVAHVAAKKMRRIEDAGKHAQCEQGQQPAHPHHDRDDKRQHKDVFEDREDARGEHVVERIDVRGQARNQAANWIAIEERHMHLLNMAKDLAAQIEHDLLAGPLHHVGLHELEHKDQPERGEIQKSEFGDAADRIVAELRAEPRALLRRRRKKRVDRNLDEVGAEHIAPGLEHNRHGGDTHL